MRTRRQVIIGGTATVLGLSGCLDEVPEEERNGEDGNETDGVGNETDGEDGEGDGPTDEGNETDTDDEPATAEFEVRSFATPSTVEIGESVEWSLSVENVGDADGTFETEVTVGTPGRGEDVSTVSLDVPAGETRDTAMAFRPDYVGEYVVTVEETGDRSVTEAEVRELGFGDEYVNPDDVTMTVDGTEDFYEVRLTSSYTYTDDEGDSRFDRAGEDMRYAIVQVRATKETRDLVDMPERDEFTMFVGDDAYDPVDRLRDDEYEGGPTRGRSREGIVMFEIDDRYQRTDTFEIYWTRDYDDGSAESIWST
ncbi:MAG: hypothetical protein ACLFSW_05105 [Halobacteriales archaeon]